MCVGSQLSTFTLVVLVLVDLLGKLILLLVEGLAIFFGELTVIHLAHVTLFLVQCVFFLLQVASLMLRELAALHALMNPILLILFPLTDGRLFVITVGFGEACRCEHRRECE